MAALYATRHCHDVRAPPCTPKCYRIKYSKPTHALSLSRGAQLRVYHFLPRSSPSAAADAKGAIACSHPLLGGRAAPWCKLLALADTLSSRRHDNTHAVAYDWVAWLDSDLFFHDTTRAIPALVREFGGASREAASVCAWFASNWPWSSRWPNSGFFALRNSDDRAALQLLHEWWSLPLGRTWNTRHQFEQGALHALWPAISSAGAGRRAAVLRSRASGEWSHMSDVNSTNFAPGPVPTRASRLRGAPTTHMAEGNSIVPAHPYSRAQTFPSMLTALSLDVLARAAATGGESGGPPPPLLGACGRVRFFRARAPNATIHASSDEVGGVRLAFEPERAWAVEVPPEEWMRLWRR